MNTTPTNQELQPKNYVFVNAYNQFYQIGEVEPFQYDTGQEATAFFSAVAAGASSGFKNITEIEPDDKPSRHLFQALVGVQYAFNYFFKIPTGTSRFGSDVTKGIGYIDAALSPFYKPNKDFQMWFVKSYYPAISATNTASAETLTPAVRFTGFKYELLDIKDSSVLDNLQTGRQPYKHITVGGLRC